MRQVRSGQTYARRRPGASCPIISAAGARPSAYGSYGRLSRGSWERSPRRPWHGWCRTARAWGFPPALAICRCGSPRNGMKWDARPVRCSQEMPMGSLEIQFDPAWVEEAVFLELKRRRACGDRHMAAVFHAQRSSLYGASGAADERDARFQQLAERYFHALGFAELVTKRFDECPLVAALVQMARVQRVWSRKEERVELYVRPAPPGRASIEASTTLLLGLQAARCLNRDELVAFLRHELMHICDMLDQAFAYEPHPEFGGECDTENDLIRERFRLLWNLFVGGRMRRRGWPLPGAERSRRGLDQAFASWEPKRYEAVLQDLGSRDRCTQRELLELAKDERLTRMKI